MPSIFLDFERSVAASAGEVRAAINASLHDLGFETTTEEMTLIEGRRGHPLGGVFLGASSAPVQISARIAATPGTTHVVVRLADHLASLGRVWGANTTYQKVFAAIRESIDAALASLDPAAATGFAAPTFTSKTATIGVVESTNRVTADLTGAALGKFNEMLSGGPRTRIPDAWKTLDTVLLCSDEGAARLDIDELRAHLAVAMLIASQPGSLPPALAAQVEALATRIEEALAGAGSNRHIEIPITDAEEPVVEFLHQQARMREEFAVRTLHRCRTCKFEKVTNPDLQRLQKRNQRLRDLGGSVGAVIGKSGISPFVLVGTVFKFANLDPDYICPRCEGTDAEATVVTFCPDCGALRAEAALRLCAQCHVDLRTKIPHDQLWQPYPAPEPQPTAVAGGTAATPWTISTEAPPPPPPPPPPAPA